MDNETRKRLITGHMTEIMQLLNLDLSDDSLISRIAVCMSMRFFSELITLISRKLRY